MEIVQRMEPDRGKRRVRGKCASTSCGRVREAVDVVAGDAGM